MKIRTLYFLMLSTFIAMRGQEPQLPVPPPGPLVQKTAADFAQWTITQSTVQNNSSAGNGTPTAASTNENGMQKPKSIIINIIKTEPIRVQETSLPDGKTWRTWYPNPATAITVWPDGKSATTQNRLAMDGASVLCTDFTKSDFPDFSWINTASYGGLQSYQEKKCLVFYGRILESGAFAPIPFQGNPPSASNDLLIAYVDMKTRLPVAIQQAASLQSYQFQPPPKDMLVLPDVVRTAINQQKKAEVSMTPRAIRPY